MRLNDIAGQAMQSDQSLPETCLVVLEQQKHRTLHVLEIEAKNNMYKKMVTDARSSTKKISTVRTDCVFLCLMELNPHHLYKIFLKN